MNRIVKYIVSGLIGCIFAFIVTNFLFQVVVVNGESMSPTYHDQQVLLMKKFANHYQRKQVVVFYEKGEQKYLIKRIIGLPGETIQIKNGYTYINGKKYEDPNFKQAMNDGGLADGKIKLEDNEYFVMGDNRNHSNDSRFLGPISCDCIQGKIVFQRPF